MAYANKQAAFAYNNEYQKEKYERVTVLLKKEKGKALKAYCKEKGVSASAFMEQCLDEKLKRLKIEL